jgi:hypothetical protein
MEGYEVSLLSGSGPAIASTGFSNAIAPLRINSTVKGYEHLLNVEVSDPKYSFWTAEMILAMSLSGVLSVAVFVLTVALRRDIRALKRQRRLFGRARNASEQSSRILRTPCDSLIATEES